MTEKWGKIKNHPSLSYRGSTVLVALVRDCSSSFFTLWKESPVFPWSVASVEVSGFSQRVLYAWAFFGLIHAYSPPFLPPPPTFPFTHSMFLTQQFSFGNFNFCLLKVLSFWVFTDCQSRVFSCARRTSWGIISYSCACCFYHYHPHCWAKHFASVT